MKPLRHLFVFGVTLAVVLTGCTSGRSASPAGPITSPSVEAPQVPPTSEQVPVTAASQSSPMGAATVEVVNESSTALAVYVEIDRRPSYRLGVIPARATRRFGGLPAGSWVALEARDGVAARKVRNPADLLPVGVTRWVVSEESTWIPMR
jgi:hypothetical protein